MSDGPVIIPKSSWFLPANGTKPIIECPKCQGSLLGENSPHGIKSDGTIHASVICGHFPCDFHAHCKLEGWTNGVVPHS